MENEIDLFEHYETLPQVVQDVLEAFGEVEGYEGCRALIDALEPLGYTCEYGLDACPHSLSKLPVTEEMVDMAVEFPAIMLAGLLSGELDIEAMRLAVFKELKEISK